MIKYKKDKVFTIKKPTNMMPFLFPPEGDALWESFELVIRLNQGDKIRFLEKCERGENFNVWYRVMSKGKEGFVNPKSL